MQPVRKSIPGANVQDSAETFPQIRENYCLEPEYFLSISLTVPQH